MDLFLLCIFVNVLLGVLFKLFPKYNIDNLQAITINYFVSFALGSFLLGKWAISSNFFSQDWFPFALFLAVVFIIGFNITAITFQKFGITFTTIVQKMSLIIPVCIAILYFSEKAGIVKFIGILTAMGSIILINLKNKGSDTQFELLLKKYWYYPLFTLIISGVVELILLYMEKKSITSGNDIEFVTILFGMAGLLGLIIMITRYFYGIKTIFSVKNLIAGILLGVPNFFTIYFLVLLLAKWDGTVVFPINNVGILSISAIVAVLFFKEKINRNRLIGLSLAILSIYLISQF